METWNDFYEALRFECNKGNLYDSIFQEKTFQTLRAVEQNWSYRWMEQFAQLQIDLGSENPQVITLPAGFKKVLSIKLVDSNGGAINLVEVPAEDFVPGVDGVPSGYFVQGGRYLWLDKNPGEAYKVVLFYDKFTLQSELEGSLTHPILTAGGAMLVAGTMVNLAPTAREASWIETYTPIYQAGLHTLHVWDEESRMADNEVIFGGRSGSAVGE